MPAYAYDNAEAIAVREAPLYEEVPVRSGLYRAGGKRLLDVLLVLISAPAVLLILLPMALLVACDGSNPFYTQMRVGLNGRIYRMWKLRSMVPDAEARLKTHLAEDPEARAEWDHHQKLKNDPRITRVGRILRKCSLDELPQLWNVLRGDMSLVGPRPMMEDQRAFYPAKDYYALRPGITGLWQVSARNESAFSDRAHFDTDYNRRLSLKEDAKILVATVGVVVKGTGH
ncbi:sugar transferase [Pacificoceanicola onchidii]|uniref:sugar transferase n=1 Tax=Pacificoceanicola onchidii TaxID=2562685 RepID=UPI0010A60C03|nr:sugar transferase [Pacificoceanicola onchidii]